ncbi:MAG: LysM peptidoglycan-binding domain-containing protein [Gammaproteobacteria bacterium]
MSGKIGIFLGSLLAVSLAFADEIALRGDHPDTYTVVKGDTLWDIAGRFLTRPWQWPEIWETNPQIENPHLIYPGDVIALRWKDGRPVLGLADGETSLGGRLVRLSPTIRETRHDDAIEPIPLDAIQQFLSRPRVMTREDIGRSGYIVGSQDEHLTFGSGNRVYVRALGEPETAKFSIFREGEAYVDPDSQAILGYEAEHVGDGLAERFGDPATVYIIKANKEIMKGDRLLPEEGDQIPAFYPHAPSGAVDGKIISVFDGVSQIGQHQVVVLNRGVADGLEPGHVLAIYQEGEIIDDVIGSDIEYRKKLDDQLRAEREHPSMVARTMEGIANEFRAADRALREFVGTPIEGGSSVRVQLPEERAGELMVFRTFDKVSYALVMNTQRPIHVMDYVRNP